MLDLIVLIPDKCLSINLLFYEIYIVLSCTLTSEAYITSHAHNAVVGKELSWAL